MKAVSSLWGHLRSGSEVNLEPCLENVQIAVVELMVNVGMDVVQHDFHISF